MSGVFAQAETPEQEAVVTNSFDESEDNEKSDAGSSDSEMNVDLGRAWDELGYEMRADTRHWL